MRRIAIGNSTTKVAIAIVEHEDHFLVGVRPAGVPLAGFAEFPGGKVLSTEAFFDAAARECREETGLKVRPERLLLEKRHAYSHGTLHMQFVECRLETLGSIKVHLPDAPFQWIQRRTLRSLKFPDANTKVIELLS